MAAGTQRKNDRWLYWSFAIYVLLYLLFGPGFTSTFQFRWAGFFLVAQFLVQVIFPQFRCSKAANISIFVLVIIAFITFSLTS